MFMIMLLIWFTSKCSQKSLNKIFFLCKTQWKRSGVSLAFRFICTYPIAFFNAMFWMYIGSWRFCNGKPQSNKNHFILLLITSHSNDQKYTKTTKIILCAPLSSLSKLGQNYPRVFLSGHIPLPCTPSRSCRCSSSETDARCWCGSHSLQLQENCSTKVWQPDHGIASCTIQSWSTALQVGGVCRGCPGKFTCYQSPFLLCPEDSCSKPWRSQRCGTNGYRCSCCCCWRNHS